MMIDAKGCLAMAALLALACFALYAMGSVVVGWL